MLTSSLLQPEYEIFEDLANFQQKLKFSQAMSKMKPYLRVFKSQHLCVHAKLLYH